MGKVLDIRPDAEGLVRAVRLQTRTSILERPVTKLYYWKQWSNIMTLSLSASIFFLSFSPINLCFILQIHQEDRTTVIVVVPVVAPFL